MKKSWIDKVFGGVFTSYWEYIEFKMLRDRFVNTTPDIGSSAYLSSLDADEEAELDSKILHTLAVSVLKGEFSRDYCKWVLDGLEARRALIRKYSKKK